MEVFRLILYKIIEKYKENNGIIDLPEIRGEVLERVVQYLYYNRTYFSTFYLLYSYMGSLRQPPEFEVDPAMALDLLAAANYLEC